MIWVRRLMIGSGIAAASFVMAAPVAGAVDTYVSTPPTVTGVSTPPPTSGLPFTSSVPPAVVSTTTTTGEGSSSLPFTGADIAELAVIGVGAVAAGRLLMVRRRRSVA